MRFMFTVATNRSFSISRRKLSSNREKNGGNREGLSASAFGEFWVIVPIPAEQRQIADYLDNKCSEIDNLIAIKQQKIEELKDYRKSIIYEYVTGKNEI